MLAKRNTRETALWSDGSKFENFGACCPLLDVERLNVWFPLWTTRYDFVGTTTCIWFALTGSIFFFRQ